MDIVAVDIHEKVTQPLNQYLQMEN